jgi:V8-like Glu-specific endopeptidase
MWKFTELTYFLAALYYRQEEIISLIINAGLKPQSISQSSKAIVFWTNILDYAEKRDKIQDIVKAVISDGHEGNKYLEELLRDINTTFKSPYSNGKVDANFQIDEGEFEKLTQGKNSILPIAFLEQGIHKSRCVVRIVTDVSLGSGFIVGTDYILTNNHVINSKNVAVKTKIQLNYQLDLSGEPIKFIEFSLDPDSPGGFATSVKNDWTLVRIKDFTSAAKLEFGFLPLKKLIVTKNDFVNIIQHPSGEHKQIALYHNIVVGINEDRLQYLTDTLPGSSGSPVFNSKWDIVSLHHSGKKTKIFNTGSQGIVNEGININKIIDEITQTGILINLI